MAAENNIIIKITAEDNLDKTQKDLQDTVDQAMRLEEEYVELNREMTKTRTVLGRNSKEYKELTERADKNRHSIERLTKGIKLTDMSMNALRQRSQMLRDMLDSMSRSADPKGFERLRTQLDKTERAMDKLGKQSTASKIKEGVRMKTLAAVAGAYYALKNAIRDAVNTIIEFDKASATLASVTGKTQKQVKALTDEAKRLGAITSYTATQMIDLQTELAKLGFTEGEILKATESVQRFATATGADLASAAGLAGSTMRAFGLEASNMERVVSTMAVATTKSALDFNALDTAMSTVAPVAKSLGFTIEDTTALLGTLANSGFDASSAATATRNILLNLSDSSGKLAKALGKPVKSLDDLIPALKGLQERGIDLSEALELTDKRSVSAFNTFMSGVGTLKELRDGITDVSDELKAMEETRLDTVEGSIDLLKSAWDGLILSMSGSSGVMKDVLNWITELINKTNDFVNNGGIRELAGSLLGDDDVKREIANNKRAREENKKLEEDMANFRKKNLEDAKKYHEDLLSDEDEFIRDRESRANKAYANGNMEAGDFYSQQIQFVQNYRQKRIEALSAMELDELKVQEEAQKREEEERKKKQKEREREAKKNRQIALQELQNQIDKSNLKNDSTESDYSDSLSKQRKKAELEAQIQIDSLNRMEIGERAYAAQVSAIRIELQKKLRDIDEKEVERTNENAKRRTEIEVQAAEARKNVLTGAEGIDQQKAVVQDYYDTLKKQIEENAEMERQAVERSTDTAEVKAEKLKQINAQMNADIVANTRAAAQDLIAIDDTRLDELQRKADTTAAAVDKAQGVGKLDALKNNLDAQTDLYNAQMDSVKSKYEQGLISYSDYKQQEFDITKQIADAEAEYQASKMQEITDGFQTALGYMQQVSDLAFEALGNNVQAELDALDEMYTTDAEEAKKNADKKYISEKDYEKKKAELEMKQAKYAKAQALINAGINTAMAIITTLAQLGATPWGIAQAAIAGAMGAAQMAIIAAKPLAQYAKGRKGGQGEYALVGEKGAEIMYVPHGASIIPHDKIDQPEAWGAYGVPQLPIPASANINPTLLDQAVAASQWQPIDYDRLGQAVAKAMPKQRAVNVNVDRHGVTVQSGNDTRTYLNTKYQAQW